MNSAWTLVIFFSAILSTCYCCEVTRENVTWHYTDGQDSFIPGIDDKNNSLTKFSILFINFFLVLCPFDECESQNPPNKVGETILISK